MLILSYLICRFIVSSKIGNILIGIRDRETRMRFLGYNTTVFKIIIFTFSAVLAGIAGALYVPQVGIINPGEFSPIKSIEIVVWVALGGRGFLYGAIIGAIVVNILKSYLTIISPEIWIIFGSNIYFSNHLLAEWFNGFKRIIKKNYMIEDKTILEIKNVTVSFDGFKALNSLSLEIKKSQMIAIIGPNGAGKTTLQDVITGKTKIDDGKIFFKNNDLSQFSEHEIVNLGIGRKFQRPTIIENISVWDNLCIALNTRKNFLSCLLFKLKIRI